MAITTEYMMSAKKTMRPLVLTEIRNRFLFDKVGTSGGSDRALFVIAVPFTFPFTLQVLGKVLNKIDETATPKSSTWFLMLFFAIVGQKNSWEVVFLSSFTGDCCLFVQYQMNVIKKRR